MAIYIDRNAPESGIASLLAMQGRRGDTELVHMTKPEVKTMMNTGLMSMNKETGLPEFGKGGDILKFLIPMAASVAFPALLGPSIGSALGIGALGGGAVATGLGSLAGGLLTGQDPGDALMSGLLSGGMSYGLGSMFPETFGIKEASAAGLTDADLQNIGGSYSDVSPITQSVGGGTNIPTGVDYGHAYSMGSPGMGPYSGNMGLSTPPIQPRALPPPSRIATNYGEGITYTDPAFHRLPGSQGNFPGVGAADRSYLFESVGAAPDLETALYRPGDFPGYGPGPQGILRKSEIPGQGPYGSGEFMEYYQTPSWRTPGREFGGHAEAIPPSFGQVPGEGAFGYNRIYPEPHMVKPPNLGDVPGEGAFGRQFPEPSREFPLGQEWQPGYNPRTDVPLLPRSKPFSATLGDYPGPSAFNEADLSRDYSIRQAGPSRSGDYRESPVDEWGHRWGKFKDEFPTGEEFKERLFSEQSLLPAASGLGGAVLGDMFSATEEEASTASGPSSVERRQLEYNYNLAPNQLEGLNASQIRAILEQGNLARFYQRPSSGAGVFSPSPPVFAQTGGGIEDLISESVTVSQNPFEGRVTGQGHGMQDNQMLPIMEKGGIAAVSPDEYVVPADVMSMIGNGSANSGADTMDDFIEEFRTVKYGRPTQPPEINPRGALQSLMKT